MDLQKVVGSECLEMGFEQIAPAYINYPIRIVPVKTDYGSAMLKYVPTKRAGNDKSLLREIAVYEKVGDLPYICPMTKFGGGTQWTWILKELYDGKAVSRGLDVNVRRKLYDAVVPTVLEINSLGMTNLDLNKKANILIKNDLSDVCLFDFDVVRYNSEMTDKAFELSCALDLEHLAHSFGFDS